MKNTSLLLADLHLHHLPNWRYDWCCKFVDEIIAKSESYGHLWLLGDVFEIKDRLDSRVLNLFLRLVGDCRNNGCEVVWLTGQHDSYMPQLATLEQLSLFGITVIDRAPVELNGVWFVPFFRDENLYRDALAAVPDNAILMTHMPIKEIVERYTGKAEKGISVKEFVRFRKVISGDIHKYEDIENLSYVGAPSQRDWRDAQTVGCYGEFDLSNKKFNRVFTKHPIHLAIKDKSDLDQFAICPSDQKFIIKINRDLYLMRDERILSIQYLPLSDKKVAKIKELANLNTTVTDDIDAYIKSKRTGCGNLSAEKLRQFAVDLIGD